MRVLIKGGKIVTEKQVFTGDLLLEDDKIKAIEKSLDFLEDKVYDATGCLILPGGVDQHVHFDYACGKQQVRGFETSAAALLGGTTTIADFVNQAPHKTLAESVELYRQKVASPQACCDFALHCNIKRPGQQELREISCLPAHGVRTLNLFLSDTENPDYLNDQQLIEVLGAAKAAGLLTFVHAENGDLANWLSRQLVAAGKTEPRYHGLGRSELVEIESVNRVCAMSSATGAPVMLTHLTCRGAVEVLQRYQANGAPVYGETCPQYLVLNQQYLDLPGLNGAKYVCNPPLRAAENQPHLWRALRQGTLVCVATDHCAFDFGQKQKGYQVFSTIPKGVPGLQDRFYLLWTYGVMAGNLDLTELVKVFATNPAKALGIYPDKGTLKVGSSADIIIFNPADKQKFSNSGSLHGIDYNLYEGMKCLGAVETVFLRGRAVVRAGKFCGQAGQGQPL